MKSSRYHPVTKEGRDVVIKMLRGYRDNALLWNSSHPDFENRPLKREAQERLLKIYQELEPGADIFELKKKLDNMRSSGKRYFLKKLQSKAKNEHYSVPLWYYKHIKFVYNDEDSDSDDSGDGDRNLPQKEPPTKSITISSDEDERTQRNESDYIDFDNFDAKSSTSFNDEFVDFSIASSIALSNVKNKNKRKLSMNGDDGEKKSKISLNDDDGDETIQFGTEIKKQLSEASPEQRVFAKELIARVAYLAKLNKLTVDTDISLKSSN